MDEEVTQHRIDRLADELRQSRRVQPEDLLGRAELWTTRETLRINLLVATVAG